MPYTVNWTPEMIAYLLANQDKSGDEIGRRLGMSHATVNAKFREMGIHRLVRISPFNAAGKRQTSFVSCDVMPDIEEDVDIEVRDEDIRIDTYRSSGAG